MSKPIVQFHFDFGSPNSYFCHKVIPAIEQRTGVSIEYIPVLLGGLFRLTGNRSPAEAFAGIKNKPEYGRLEIQRFMRQHQLEAFRTNPHFPVNTLQIMRGAVAAQLEGCFEHYVDTVFSAMWEQEQKMDDAEVIQRVLNNASIDAQRLLSRTSDPAVKETLLQNTQDSFERGAFGSPTFFVDGEIYFGKDRLREVEEEIERVKAL